MRKIILVISSMAATVAFADTAIETETAQIGKKGDFGFSQSIEFEKASDGHSRSTLTQFEYGISDRAEILIEPFFHIWDSPNGEEKVDGQGDLEITPSYMAVMEDGAIPAVLVAMKVKVPTGSKKVEGTGKYDYYPYLIFGQHYNDWTFNANLGVNFANPEDSSQPIDKTVVWDLEAEHAIGHNWTWFIETFSAEDGVLSASTAFEYQYTKHFNAFVAVGYNEDHSLIIRPGFNLEF